MNLFFIMVCLIGCDSTAVKPDRTTTTRTTAPSTIVITSTEQEARRYKDWEQLTKACRIPEVPADAKERDVTDVAVEVANARKAALEECSKRMKQLRKKLNKERKQ